MHSKWRGTPLEAQDRNHGTAIALFKYQRSSTRMLTPSPTIGNRGAEQSTFVPPTLTADV